MQPFTISCPGCGTRFTVRTAGALGQTRPCPKCGAPIEIVDPSAPPTPPRRLQPWNRWALVGGTAAALLVLIAVLVFSRGGAAGSSAGQSVAAADASGEDEIAEEAATAEPPEPVESKADPAPEQSVRQPDGDEADTDALEAELERVLADSAAERARIAAQEPSEDPDQAAGEASAGPRSPAAPSAAERARMAAERSQEVSQPSRDSQRSLLGPASNLPDLAGGDGAVSGAQGDGSTNEQTQEGGDSKSGSAETGSDGAADAETADGASEPAETDDPVYFRMHRKIVLYECDKRPLESLLEELSDLSALDVSLDYAALDRLRVDFETPVTLQLEDTNLAGILSAIVEPLKLTYIVTGEKILITAPSEKHEEGEGEDGSEESP